MTTLVAMGVASLVGWLVEGPSKALFGSVGSMAVGLVVGTFAFYYAKRFLSDLRS